MTFRAYQECSGSGCPYFVLAQGVITTSTPGDFQRFLAREQYQPVVYFDSPGGNLIAALQLGRIIRARGLDTFVGGPYEAFMGFGPRGAANEITRRLVSEGICFSACAYAFLGGVSRELSESGRYGIHQFYSGGRPLGDASTQVAMTVLASYLDDMGVDRRLLDLASLTPSTRLGSLPMALAHRLLVDNTEPELAPWKVDTTSSGKLYAYTIQQQPRRDAKVSFVITAGDKAFNGMILYRVRQKFRSSKQLDEIFLEESHNFPDTLGNVTLASIKIPVASNWTGNATDGYSMRFTLDRVTIEALLAGPSFEFHPSFPRVYSDVSPEVTFSSERLRQCLLALSR
jgi:hypothetical protein